MENENLTEEKKLVQEKCSSQERLFFLDNNFSRCCVSHIFLLQQHWNNCDVSKAA